MDLKRRLFLALSVVGAAAISAAIALVVLTSYVQDAIWVLNNALQSTRIAVQAEAAIVHYARSEDPVVKARLQAEVRRRLSQADRFMIDERGRATLGRAKASVEAYLNENQSADAFEKADASLRELIDLNVGHAVAEENRVDYIDRFSSSVGVTAAALLIAGVGSVLIWLVLYAFKPVYPIRDAMWKFAHGERSARAPEQGPAEFRTIAAEFNELADTLVRHRENQLESLAGVAHDLRNPLSALNVSASLLAADSLAPARRNDLVDLIKRQIRYLDRMVGDLLDASRAEAGELELRTEKSDLKGLVEEACSLFRDVSARHRIAPDFPNSPVLLDCDPVRIQQVLVNMISNAIKYSPEGGEVRVVLRDSSDAVTVAVSDDGIGIPNHEVSRIFEPFHRSHSSKQNIPGIGLGLSVARRIIEGHGGRIDVESAVDHGATFRINLPKNRQTQAS